MSEKDLSETEKYIRKHIHSVQKRMYILMNELMRRCELHDHSKLEKDELPGWEEMDEEPRYPYGSPEYFDKMRRYDWLLNRHYKNHDNKHHPEHVGDWWAMEMDLVDLMEMVCDWCAYKDEISSNEILSTVNLQFKRFNVPIEFQNLIVNTIMNYFVTDPNVKKDYDNTALIHKIAEEGLAKDDKLPETASNADIFDEKNDSKLELLPTVNVFDEPMELNHKLSWEFEEKPKSAEIKKLDEWLNNRIKQAGIEVNEGDESNPPSNS